MIAIAITIIVFVECSLLIVGVWAIIISPSFMVKSNAAFVAVAVMVAIFVHF